MFGVIDYQSCDDVPAVLITVATWKRRARKLEFQVRIEGVRNNTGKRPSLANWRSPLSKESDFVVGVASEDTLKKGSYGKMISYLPIKGD